MSIHMETTKQTLFILIYSCCLAFSAFGPTTLQAFADESSKSTKSNALNDPGSPSANDFKSSVGKHAKALPTKGAQDNSAQNSKSTGTPVPRKFKAALPGYRYRFPEDHFSHDEFKTEWWYYTGHLESADHKAFGYELTFFRSGVPISDGVKGGAWEMKNVYMAHFAVSDIGNKKFFHDEKLSRAGAGSAGASGEKEYKVWIENWSASSRGAGRKHFLVAKSKGYSIDFELDEGKIPAIHGAHGVSQKASCAGCASHYYSLTRMPTKGVITVGDKQLAVQGTSWMDHEFGSNQLTADQVGWDWFSVQLDDGSDLMLYLMRLKNGSYDKHSSGTLINSDGSTTHLALNDYKVEASKLWNSPHTGGKYPTSFHVTIPSKQIDLQLDSVLADQELASKDKTGISYWEGACRVKGTKAGSSIAGRAYVEMTGYSEAFTKKI